MKTGIDRKKFCVIGTPVAHSKSPELFARIFEERGLTDSCTYEIHEVHDEAELQTFVRELYDGTWSGCNVTMPWKTAVAMLPEIALGPAARMNTSVNTLVRRSDGTLYGDSTDGAGMCNAIEKTCDVRIKGSRVVLLGAGGAARSVLTEMYLRGAKEIFVVCRPGENRDKAVELTGRLKEYGESGGAKEGNGAVYFIENENEPLVSALIGGADMLINCTPVGMKNTEAEGGIPIPEGLALRTELIVADAIYNPEITPLLELANNFGCRTVPGMRMLEEQARVGADILLGAD